jgi:PadR family transcriptional regulator PadR
MKADALKGQLELVVLATLRDNPLHGYGIIKQIRDRTAGELDVLEGTLYTALHRLESVGMVNSRWETGAGRRRRVYELTPKGRNALAAQESEWRSFARTLDVILGRTP